MKLRKLYTKDIPFMLEWMKDEDINKYFRFNSENISIESTKNFIEESNIDKCNQHLAITNNNDEYLGTISLKNIDYYNSNAEYAIALRKNFQGKGIGKFATYEILKFAFTELNLEKVYLNVLSENLPAINFYEKFGFIYEGEFINHIKIKGEFKNLKWYRILKEEYKMKIKEF